MKKILLTSAIIMVVGAANATISPYISIKSGYADGGYKAYYYKPSHPRTYTDGITGLEGFTVAPAVGIAFAIDPIVIIRNELEYTYSKISATNEWECKQTISSNTIMLNSYADFGEASWKVKPYVGFGLGWGSADYKEGGDSNHEEDMGNGFAYAGMIGAAWSITQSFALDLGFKYTVIDGVQLRGIWGYGDSMDATMRSVTLGARYTF